MYQQVRSATFSQLLSQTKSMSQSHLPCINMLDLPPSLSCSDEVKVSELPPIHQQVRSATFSQLLSQTTSMSQSHLPCVNKLGLPPSLSCSVRRSQCLWITFHASTSLVCHLLSVAHSTETSTTKSVFIWYRIQGNARVFFCLFFFITVYNDVTLTKYLEKSSPHDRHFPFAAWNDLRVFCLFSL